MKFTKLQLAAAAVMAMGALLAAPAHAGKTLDAIKARGQVICGVNTGLAGLPQPILRANGPGWTLMYARRSPRPP